MEAAASAAILAGGKSTRMRTAKAFLEVGGQAVISRIVTELACRFDEVLVVTNEPSRYEGVGGRVVTDIIPGRGPLSGIHSALHHAAHPLVFVTACDMPFVSGILARGLVALIDGYDCAVPVVHNYVEPLFAVYRRSCLKPIEDCLNEGRLKVVDLFSRVRVKYIKESEIPGPVMPETFFNINYPRDWARARAMVRHGGTPPELPPFICIAGTSGAGKTVLVTRLVHALRRRGLRVGTVKHAPHGAELLVEGTDSWRHFQSGAEMSVVVTPDAVAAVRRTGEETPLEDVLAGMTGVDLVLVEGYKGKTYPKVIVNSGDPGPVDTAGAVTVAGAAVPGLAVPTYDRDDIAGLAREVLRYLGLELNEE
ncbi:MAG: bifunctional molybdenum cofactor guanylyltransferase MobA/molybdopterin-guanine dinucleotide biosynthesis adaptor protein MobB [Thermoanaerobacterales bacterium]|nr:bifunctional molybdenum cofactor guanylyltransferase MobA/molybdopterin-guanine dinucleotide biosynthesis adaptor protein MobB [Bacillota bacterium]MDI6906732.1 bifunctional molybdenum cofactor guanylyltransferase MobA/molybdopterin-guanine dinucleotide biosynthesis adaptor protein MobB [Thermoanaerobacterales bacterium]